MDRPRFDEAWRYGLLFVAAALVALMVIGFIAGVWMTTPARGEVASWYGGKDKLHGRRTASGERFDQNAMTAAHRSLAFGTRLRVCRSGCVIVRVTDRGPFIAGRSIDLSAAAARRIGLTRVGVGRVSVERIR